MEVIDGIKSLQPLVESNFLSEHDYEEIRSYALADPSRTNYDFTTNNAIFNLRRLYDLNKINEETFILLRDNVSKNYVLKENNNIENDLNKSKQKEPLIKGTFLGFIFGFFLNIIGLILCVTLGDKKAKISSIITAISEIAVSLIITIVLTTIFLVNPNIIFPNGL